jgi:formiminotetrahydrofolate cyclodeaminase
MTYDTNNTIAQFLDGTAAKQPAPGGGSVAALVGALSAAMGEMVLNYSVGKKGLEAHQDDLKQSLAELHRARRLMLELLVEDQSAFQALSAARKLPPDSKERQTEFPAALLAAIRTPEALAAAAVEIIELCDRLVDSVNYYLLSDLAVCADVAMATVRCGIYNVKANLPDVTEPSDLCSIEETTRRILARGVGAIQRAIPRIWERHRSGK